MLKTWRVEKTVVEGIIVPERRRRPSPQQISAMAASLAEFGLLTPIGIQVTDKGDGILVYGATRLDDAPPLGWATLDPAILEGDEIDFREAEIGRASCRERV